MKQDNMLCDHPRGEVEGVYYPYFELKRVEGVLLCSECHKPVSRCYYCDELAWGVYVRGYFCYEHRPDRFSHLAKKD